MRRFVKWTAVIGMAFGMVGASSDWLTAYGYDFWRYSAYHQQLMADEGMGQALDEQLETSEGRLILKEQAVRDFLARRTTFATLVDLFQQVNEGNGQLAQYMRDFYPAADAREIAARNAVQFVLSSVPKDAPTRGTVLSRVLAEFDRQFPRSAAPSL